ncbi:MAG: 50S ribosomal protein L4 [bacterium]|nr:50S ribosomal protein L4 [bacterium]
MPKVAVYNVEGKQVREIELSDAVFGTARNDALVHQVIVAQQARPRRAIADTKDKGEVRGGGKKPWKQKGTGRARHGSIRSPIWVGGGITFGPTSDRNFAKRIPKKMAMGALKSVLSDKVRDQKFIILESLAVLDAKTKTFASIIKKLPLDGRKTTKMLIALSKSETGFVRAARNIPHVFVTTAVNVSVLNVVQFPYFVTTEEAVRLLEERCV